MSFTYIKLFYLSLWLVWSIIQTLILYQAGFDLSLVITDALISNFFLAATGYALNISLQFYQPEPKKVIILFTWTFGLAAFFTFLIYWILRYLFSGEFPYLQFLHNSLSLRFAFSWLLLSFMALLSWLWFYINEQQEAKNRNTAAEKLARETELSKLRQQLQPHFLFNSLNSISALITIKPELARTMIQQLSDFLRGTLKKEAQQMVTLEEELKHLALYLDIEKVRFGDRLRTAMDIADNCNKLKIPPLLLQPIVENAIKFGLYDTTGETVIQIRAIEESGYLKMIIENPFDPVTSRHQKGTGFGLESIKRRLYLLFARNDLVDLKPSGEIYVTQIKIPQL